MVKPYKLFLIFALSIILTFINQVKVYSSSPWQPTTSLNNSLASHSSLAYSNIIFVFGGATGVVLPSNIYNTNNIDGSLNNWNTSINSPSIFWHSSTNFNNYTYLIGGATNPPTNSINTVYLGTILLGNISSWMTVTPLPQSISRNSSLVHNGKLYVAGGFREQAGIITFYNQNIYNANINTADGSLGTWSDVGDLPYPLSGFGMFVDGDNIIIVGGENLTGKKDKSYYAHINSDGTVGTWTETSTLPKPLSRAQFSKSGNKIFVLGGIDSNGTSDEVYYTEINADGSLDAWQTAVNKIPQPTCCGTATAIGNYLYLIGGHNSNNGEYYDDVFYADINNILQTGLNVPYYNQNDLPWGPTEYDSAASLGDLNPTMDRWGCAVTSAAMVMNYYGMKNMPDNSALDPGSLNEWLKNNHGYNKGINSNGWYSGIKWNHISLLTKELYSLGKSDKKLVLNKIADINSNTNLTLDEDLTTNGIPNILLVSNAVTSGHYVVAKGKTDTTYRINDPEWDYLDLTYFDNTYKRLIRYTPSLTDFSYFDMSINPEIQILLKDNLGRKTGAIYENGQKIEFNEIPNAKYFFQLPVSNPNAVNSPENLGSGFNQILLPQPDEGNYEITLSANSNIDYEFNITSYEIDGDYIDHKMKGVLSINSNEVYNLNYQTNNDSHITIDADYDDVIRDVIELRSANLILKDSVSNHLIRLLEQAKRDFTDNQFTSEQRRLSQFEKLIIRENGGNITQSAYQILDYDLSKLRL